jgi:hypothetical protein
MSNQINQIAEWQKSVGLDQMPYIHRNEVANCMEEMLETFDMDSNTARLEATKVLVEYDFPYDKDTLGIVAPALVDAYVDNIVYSVGAIMKLGYIPELCIDQCLRELADRTGKYSPALGKWQKEPKKPNAYVADYTKCKRG